MAWAEANGLRRDEARKDRSERRGKAGRKEDDETVIGKRQRIENKGKVRMGGDGTIIVDRGVIGELKDEGERMSSGMRV